jgi:hypothetical protein
MAKLAAIAASKRRVAGGPDHQAHTFSMARLKSGRLDPSEFRVDDRPHFHNSHRLAAADS